MTATAALLAHQGGWDEILMVAAPIGIFALFLRAATRRLERRAAEADAAPTEDSVHPDDVRSE